MIDSRDNIRYHNSPSSDRPSALYLLPAHRREGVAAGARHRRARALRAAPLERHGPELAWIVLPEMRISQLFQLETPSPLAPWISLRSSTTCPPLATTLAPREEKAIVLSCARRPLSRSVACFDDVAKSTAWHALS